MTWPNGAVVPPFVRIDHVLTGTRLAVTEIAAKPGFGSDHRYLIATVAIRALVWRRVVGRDTRRDAAGGYPTSRERAVPDDESIFPALRAGAGGLLNTEREHRTPALPGTRGTPNDGYSTNITGPTRSAVA